MKNPVIIHKDIQKKLKHFLDDKDIPNIIFYGPSGNGKHTLVEQFVNNIYNNDANLFKNEAPDLMYHYLILLKAKNFELADIEQVLLDRSKK